MKLEILSDLLSKSNYALILEELESYAKQGNKTFIGAVTDAIYLAAQVSDDPAIIKSCLEGLQHLLLCYRGDAVAGVIANNVRKLVMMVRDREVAYQAVKVKHCMSFFLLFLKELTD